MRINCLLSGLYVSFSVESMLAKTIFRWNCHAKYPSIKVSNIESTHTFNSGLGAMYGTFTPHTMPALLKRTNLYAFKGSIDITSLFSGQQLELDPSVIQEFIKSLPVIYTELPLTS